MGDVMMRKLIIALACLISGMLAIWAIPACADSDSEWASIDRPSMMDALYVAYRHYGYVKTCHERQHVWATYVSDDELDHAKEKILIIETDTLKENCHAELMQLFQTKSSAGKVKMKKDF